MSCHTSVHVMLFALLPQFGIWCEALQTSPSPVHSIESQICRRGSNLFLRSLTFCVFTSLADSLSRTSWSFRVFSSSAACSKSMGRLAAASISLTAVAISRGLTCTPHFTQRVSCFTCLKLDIHLYSRAHTSLPTNPTSCELCM